MLKAANINLVIFLAALIISIETATDWEDLTILATTGKMVDTARSTVKNRSRDVGRTSLDSISKAQYIIDQIADAVSKPVPSFPLLNDQELFQEPNKRMSPSQLLFTRAYHSLVFEKLKTLFYKIQPQIAQEQNSKILKTGLVCVATYLRMHQDLERKWRERVFKLFSENGHARHVIERWRELELPEEEYDWDPLHNNLVPNLQNRLAQGQSPIYNDVTTGGTSDSFRMRILNAICELIAQIRADSRPFAFTEEQLLEEPNASTPQDRLDELAPADSMQLPPEDQSYAYNYEPISDHGFGYGLEASTSQPRSQPDFIDFLGVKDMTREATPELVPRLWHSHDDRDPYTDHRFGNEEHRPPSGHVGFDGGSSMPPGPSTDNIWRPCDSSLHGHQSTSNIGVADSSQQYTRFKMSGEYLDPS
ncbi:hypothetical protein SeLEV6574_g03274 [Synchytrium endobioticum]|uniref:Uncharacterized protein n=1 Tax=Synchytrium endobioticum TaxID=286115 RepID=A0A507D4J1_9FUNG|nr:hypothetical protein SeLEV6574_g03274 [Synchytrium endobioticum]